MASKFDFTVVPVGGFSQWENVKAFAWGIEKTLSIPLTLGAVFDRDYRCDEQIAEIESELTKHLKLAHIHQRKELENYLLVTSALDKAIRSRVLERSRRTGTEPVDTESSAVLLERITNPMRAEILAQYISSRTNHFKGSGLDYSNIATDAIKAFDLKWNDINTRMEIVPGKTTFSELNRYLSDNYQISLTPPAVISSFGRDDIPRDMVTLLRNLDRFRKYKT